MSRKNASPQPGIGRPRRRSDGRTRAARPS